MTEFHGGLLDRYQLLQTALSDPQLRLADVQVLAALLRRHNQREGGAWPRVSVLAKDACLSRRQVIRSLQRLEEFEYIEIDRHSGGSSFYTPHWEAIDVPHLQEF